MKTKSAKAKGRKLQDWVRDKILDYYSPPLKPGDVRPAIMGETGTDIKLSPRALEVFPFSIECKNVEKLNVWSAMDQCIENTIKGTFPLLVIKKNKKQPMVVVSAKDFFKLIHGEWEKK